MKIRKLILLVIFVLSSVFIYSENYSKILERVIAKKESHLPEMFKDSVWRNDFIERLAPMLEKELISPYTIQIVFDSLNNVQLNKSSRKFSEIFYNLAIDTDLSLKRGENAADVRLRLNINWKRLEIDGKERMKMVLANKNKALQTIGKLQKARIRVKIPVTKGEEHRTNQEIPDQGIPGSGIVGR